jgi:hypothetical protein
MRRIGIMGLLAVAALTASAMTAASAYAAAPEFGRCIKQVAVEKVYHGRFTESKCTKESPTEEGKYEWSPGVGKAQFGETGGVTVWTTAGGSGWECKTESGTGEFKAGNNKELKGVHIKFTGCDYGGLDCETPGAKSGEVVFNELEGAVGWEAKAKENTDLALFPAESVASGLDVEYSCSGFVFKIKGKILATIKNNRMTSTETVKYTATKGKQKPDEWEEEPGPTSFEVGYVVGGSFESLGLDMTASLAFEEALELNAVI